MHTALAGDGPGSMTPCLAANKIYVAHSQDAGGNDYFFSNFGKMLWITPVYGVAALCGNCDEQTIERRE